jgi:hypothetical protein
VCGHDQLLIHALGEKARPLSSPVVTVGDDVDGIVILKDLFQHRDLVIRHGGEKRIHLLGLLCQSQQRLVKGDDLVQPLKAPLVVWNRWSLSGS